MKISTHLISGAGNTFHITEQQSENPQKIAQDICQKHKADGFIFLNTQSENISWDFYNNDGSAAEMCGNATRCVGFYLSEILHSQKTKWLLKTTAGLIQIEKIKKEYYQVIMTEALKLSSTHGFYCDTGVPHLIQEIKPFEAYKKQTDQAQLLRQHPDFKPHGTNVTYIELLTEKNKVKAVSFERGVEDFTQACGTGATAAAFYNLMKRGSVETQVEMPGGSLMINLENLKAPIMQGPARLIGHYDYDEKI